MPFSSNILHVLIKGFVSGDFHDFTATVLSEGSGLVFRGLFESRAAESGCFDLYLGVGDGRDSALCYSDCAALRSVAGYRPVELREGQYAIHCNPYLEGLRMDCGQSLTLGGFVLKMGGICTEHLHQNYGLGYILVVPDEAVEGLPVRHWAYAAKTVQPAVRHLLRPARRPP